MSSQVDDERRFVKRLTLCGIGGFALALAIVLLYELSRDSWAMENWDRLAKEIDAADRVAETDSLRAYDTLERILDEASKHKIEFEPLKEKLALAEQKRNKLRPLVQGELDRRRELDRQAAEEKKRAIEEAEKKRSDEIERQRLEEETKRREEEARQVERKRIEAAVRKYGTVSQSPRDSLNALKRVEARTEVGINFAQYSEVVGQAWADVKVYVESPDGKQLPEFSLLLTTAAQFYKLGLDVWQAKIKDLDSPRNSRRDSALQLCWATASLRIKQAEQLLDPAETENVLKQIAKNVEADRNLVQTCELLK